VDDPGYWVECEGDPELAVDLDFILEVGFGEDHDDVSKADASAFTCSEVSLPPGI
jgi:hypothetical protein